MERRKKGFACVLENKKKSKKIGLMAVSLFSARGSFSKSWGPHTMLLY